MSGIQGLCERYHAREPPQYGPTLLWARSLAFSLFEQSQTPSDSVAGTVSLLGDVYSLFAVHRALSVTVPARSPTSGRCRLILTVSPHLLARSRMHPLSNGGTTRRGILHCTSPTYVCFES